MILTNPFQKKAHLAQEFNFIGILSCRIYNLFCEVLKSCENIKILQNMFILVFSRVIFRI